VRVESRLLPRFVVFLLALAAFPATPAQRLPGQRIPGEQPPGPGVTATAILPVTMEIVQQCIVSASDLDFGAYSSDSKTPARGQTAIQLTCGSGVTAEIALDAGTGAVGNTSRRQMLQDSGTDRMDYDLYQDAGRTTHWGDRSGRDTLEVLTTGKPQTVPIYGEIPSRQRVRDGTYSDVITVIVHY
jgi:spore coat protein U-like protein